MGSARPVSCATVELHHHPGHDPTIGRLGLEIGAGVTVAIAIVAGAYQVGYRQGEKELAQYKAFHEMGLVEPTNNLSIVNNELLNNFNLMSGNKRLRRESSLYTAQLRALRARTSVAEKLAKAATISAASSAAELAKLKGETTSFTLHTDKATSFPGGYIGYVSNGVIKLNNKLITVQAGSIMPLKVLDRPCQLRVESLDYPEITLALRCEKLP